MIASGPSAVAAVTTVTPVPKQPSASRKARAVSGPGVKLVSVILGRPRLGFGPDVPRAEGIVHAGAGCAARILS
ncbi:hypothetical protein GCM10010973_21590 [Cribrihabitans marinus]|nr:hypothetical protein GCM10010973_21590 [Cribrihabitans marinus]